MASTVSNLKPLGDRTHGGALFILPREIRDEIYRLLLKRDYTVFHSIVTKPHSCKNRDKKTDHPGLVILRVSRIISYEAQDILYAESTFHLTVDFGMRLEELKGPTQPLRRVRNVKVMIRGLTPQLDGYDARCTPAMYSRRMAVICEHTVDKFMGTKIRRDSCHIQLCDFGPHIFFPLTNYILPKFAAFNGFNTVVVDILREQPYRQYSNARLKPTRIFELLEGLLKRVMEPTMGPAISRNEGFTTRLEFKPREHAPSILRAQAQKLLLEADRLEEGG